LNEASIELRWIPKLQGPDTLTTLYFLVPSGIAYLNKTDDPWFSAATPINMTGLPLYAPDSPATVLGCVSKRTFCNPKIPGPEGCLDLFVSGEDAFRRVFPDAEDRIVLRPLSIVLQQYGAGGMQTFFMANSVPTLLARQTLYPLAPLNVYTGIQTKTLPSNQWQKEVEYVAQASLASMQHFLVDFARGSWFGSNGLCDKEPCRRTCHSQVCRQRSFCRVAP
jgi:hypothetical protein